MLISSPHFFLFICSVFFICSFYLRCKLTEQYTKEQQDTEAIGGETKVIESSENATHFKDSVPLSLVDNVTEITVQDSFPEEVISDFIVEADGIIERKDDSKKSATIAKVPG